MKLMTWVNQAFIREAAGLPLYTDVGRLMASNFIQPFPDYVFVDTPSIVEWVGTFLYPLALTVQLPIYMYLIVLEKEDGMQCGSGGTGDRIFAIPPNQVWSTLQTSRSFE